MYQGRASPGRVEFHNKSRLQILSPVDSWCMDWSQSHYARRLTDTGNRPRGAREPCSQASKSGSQAASHSARKPATGSEDDPCRHHPCRVACTCRPGRTAASGRPTSHHFISYTVYHTLLDESNSQWLSLRMMHWMWKYISS